MGVRNLGANNPELKVSLDHALQGCHGVRNVENNRNARVLRLKLAENVREYVLAWDAAAPEFQFASQTVAQFLDALPSGVLGIDQSLGMPVENFSGMSKLDIASESVEQHEIQGGF